MQEITNEVQVEETIKFEIKRPQADTPMEIESEKSSSDSSDIPEIEVKMERKVLMSPEPIRKKSSLEMKDEENQENKEVKGPLKERSKLWNYTTMLTVAFGGYFFGYYIVITTVLAIPLTKGVYQFNREEQDSMTGKINSFFALGGFISVLFFGKMTTIFGRAKLCIVTEICSLLVILLSLIQNIHLFLFLRLLTGFISGVNLVLLPTYCRELFPEKLAGLGGTLSYTFLTLFIVFGALIDPIFGGYDALVKYWRLALIIPLPLSIIRILLLTILIRNVETPSFFIETVGVGNYQKLKSEIMKSMTKVYEKGSAEIKTEEILVEQKKIDEEMKKTKSSSKIGFTSLLKKKYRKRFILGCVLSIFHQLTGVNYLRGFSTQLFNEINGSGAQITLILSIGGFISSIVGLFFIGACRKKTLFWFTVATAVSQLMFLGSLMYKVYFLTGISIFCFIVTFGAGLGSIKGVFNAELLPPFPNGITVGFQWLSQAAVTQFTTGFVRKFGLEFVIGGFLFFTIVHIALIHFYVKDTRGKSEEEVSKAYLV